jgi:hypothetical protein
VASLADLRRKAQPAPASEAVAEHLEQYAHMAEGARCRSCRAPIRWIVAEGTGAKTPLDVATTEIVAWTDLLEAGADRAIEDSARQVVYVGNVLVAGLRVSPGALPGVPRTIGHANHFSTCPSAGEHRRPRAERSRTEVDDAE